MSKKEFRKFLKQKDAKVKVSAVAVLMIAVALSSIFVFLPEIVEANPADWSLEATLTQATHDIIGVDFSADDSLFATGSTDMHVRVYWTSNWTLCKDITESIGISSVAFSNDASGNSKWLAAGGMTPGDVFIYNISNDYSKDYTKTDPGYTASYMEWSPDDNWLAVCEEEICIYNVTNSFALETRILDSTDKVFGAAFSNDTQWLAVTSKDTNTYIYDIPGGFIWTRTIDSAADTRGCDFSPDNKYFSFAQVGGVLSVYDAVPWSTPASWSLNTSFSDCGHATHQFSSDSKYIEYPIDTNITVRYTSNWTQARVLTNMTDLIPITKYNSDSSLLAVGCYDEDAYIFNVSDGGAAGESASSFSLSGLDDNDRITWSGEAGQTVWSNATSYGTLTIQTNANASDNCTAIYLDIADFDSTIDADNISVEVRNTADGTWDGTVTALGTSPGYNLTIDSAAGSWYQGTNPFPMDGAGWTNVTLEVRFKCAIPSGAGTGTYLNTSATWNVKWKVVS